MDEIHQNKLKFVHISSAIRWNNISGQASEEIAFEAQPILVGTISSVSDYGLEDKDTRITTWTLQKFSVLTFHPFSKCWIKAHAFPNRNRNFDKTFWLNRLYYNCSDIDRDLPKPHIMKSGTPILAEIRRIKVKKGLSIQNCITVHSRKNFQSCHWDRVSCTLLPKACYFPNSLNHEI